MPPQPSGCFTQHRRADEAARARAPLCVIFCVSSSRKGRPQMDCPPRPVPVGSPPWIMKFCGPRHGGMRRGIDDVTIQPRAEESFAGTRQNMRYALLLQHMHNAGLDNNMNEP